METGFAEFKVVIMGSSGVGKTSLVQRFNEQAFSYEMDTTIGASFLTRSLETKNGTVVLSVWDTAGQERYRSLIPTYARGAHAAVLCYDVTSQASFDELASWIQHLQMFCPVDLPIWIAAMKCDLDAVVGREQGVKFAEDNNYHFVETSAKMDLGVVALFHEIAEALAAVAPRQPSSKSIKLRKSKKEGCC